MFSIFKRKHTDVGPSPSTTMSTLDSAIDSSQSSLDVDVDEPSDLNELTPILTLLKCQSSRNYCQDELDLSVEKANSIENTQYSRALATVKGNSLVLVDLSTNRTVVNLDLLEATVKLVPDHLSILLSTSTKVAYHLRLATLESLQQWAGAIQLANYEYTRLNEIYTACLLSAKAKLLSDVHVVMSQLKYTKEEWINIKFNKNAQWLRCFAVIAPSSGKAKGTMNFYSSKRTSKKNLICSMTSVDYCHAVYPFLPELVDQSSLIKVSGDITIYNLGNDDAGDTPPLSPSTGHHRRTTSINSIASFSSTSSTKSSRGVQVHQSAMYIMPLAHGGVKPYETMMRMLMPVYDCFKLYGRPNKLIADKHDSQSLLFGMPSLPKVKILGSTVVINLIKDNWAAITSDGTLDYMELLSAQLKSIYASDHSYQGQGDLKATINRNSTLSKVGRPFTRSLDGEGPDDTQDKFFTPESSSPRYAMSINDLPVGLSQDAINKIQQAGERMNTNLQQTPQSAFQSPRVRSSSSASARYASPQTHSRNESYTNMNPMVEEVNIADSTLDPDATLTT